MAILRERRADLHGIEDSILVGRSLPIRTADTRLTSFALIGAIALLNSAPSMAQVSTTYSYNSSNRVIQAISSIGSGVQYQYDAAGNTLSVNTITPQRLAMGTPDTVTISTAGEAALLSIIVAAGQPVTLAASALMTSPSNAAVSVSVYNSAGSLVGSFNTSSGNSIDLASLSPGTYSVVVVPASSATGSLLLALNADSFDSSGGTDGPLPIWALVALGSALIGVGSRAQRRSRRAA